MAAGRPLGHSASASWDPFPLVEAKTTYPSSSAYPLFEGKWAKLNISARKGTLYPFITDCGLSRLFYSVFKNFTPASVVQLRGENIYKQISRFYVHNGNYLMDSEEES